jgi:hypothetical protein
VTAPIPDEAVEAAARAEVAYLDIDWDTPIWQGNAEDQEGFRQGYLNSNRAALTAAAPIIRASERARILAAVTDPERYAAWHQAAWDAGRRDLVEAAPTVLAGVAEYVRDQLELTEETESRG